MKRCTIYSIKRSQSLSNYLTKSYAYTINKAYRLALNLNEATDFSHLNIYIFLKSTLYFR